MATLEDRPKTRWERFKDNDIVWSFLSSPGAMIAAVVSTVMILSCAFAPLIAPFDPFDPAQISLWDGKLPPAWVEGGQSQYVLGTDNQGRDMLSTILYGGRLSILVGLAAVCFGMVLGVSLGVISGLCGRSHRCHHYAPCRRATDNPWNITGDLDQWNWDARHFHSNCGKILPSMW